jgi:hypothetical protein
MKTKRMDDKEKRMSDSEKTAKKTMKNSENFHFYNKRNEKKKKHTKAPQKKAHISTNIH